MCPSAHPSFYAFIITELIQQERTKNTKNLKINFNQIIKELSGYLINRLGHLLWHLPSFLQVIPYRQSELFKQRS